MVSFLSSVVSSQVCGQLSDLWSYFLVLWSALKTVAGSQVHDQLSQICGQLSGLWSAFLICGQLSGLEPLTVRSVVVKCVEC
jgi:hypothetical protein